MERARWERWRDALYREASDSPASRTGSTWSRTLLAALGVAAFGAVLLYPQLRRMDAVPDFGDPLFSIWRMGWVYQQILGDPRPLFSGNIFYPAPLTLTFSDSMILPSLLAAPIRAAAVHPVVVYNILFLSGFALSAIATFVLVDRLTGSGRAAFVSALIYGFYPYRFEHYSHLELQMTYWMPLALIWIHSFSATRRVRDAVIVGVIIAAQLYSSMYYGVFFLLYAAAVLGTLLLVSRQPVRRAVVPIAVALAVFVVLAVPLARPYLAAQAAKGERDEGVVRQFSALPSDYLRAHSRSALYADRLLPDRYSERALFPGTLPLVLAAAGLVPPVGPIRLAYAAGLVVAFDVSLGFNGVTYKHLYQLLLPIRGLRVPARMSVILAISLTVLAAFGVRRLLSRVGHEWGRNAVLAALVAGAALDFWPSLTVHRVWDKPPPIYAGLDPRHVVLAEFPAGDSLPLVTPSVPFMYFSLWHWLPMVNGYSGFIPSDYQPFIDSLRDFPAPPTIQALRDRGVTHVTVNCVLYRDGCRDVLDRADATDALRLVLATEWRGQPVRVYQLSR